MSQVLPVSQWIKAKKRPIDVSVSFADCDGIIHTREGDVSYVFGDAICTGVKGEQWPIPRSSFLASYTPVGQIKAGDDGLYRKTPAEVEAGCLNKNTVITNFQGVSFEGKAGDWVVRTNKGDMWVVEKEIFELSYNVYPSL